MRPCWTHKNIFDSLFIWKVRALFKFLIFPGKTIEGYLFAQYNCCRFYGVKKNNYFRWRTGFSHALYLWMMKLNSGSTPNIIIILYYSKSSLLVNDNIFFYLFCYPSLLIVSAFAFARACYARAGFRGKIIHIHCPEMRCVLHIKYK